jgi:RHS repeat-associated protein
METIYFAGEPVDQSPAVQTNNSGAVTGSNVFLPFGDLLSSTTSDVFQYTGLPQDTENSSVHAMFRNLSTTQSRWLRPDPYNGSYDLTNPQSFNRYVYAMNNPLARPDPTGLDGDCGITCAGENGDGGGGGGGGGCGLTCAGNGGNGSDPGTIPVNTGNLHNRCLCLGAATALVHHPSSRHHHSHLWLQSPLFPHPGQGVAAAVAPAPQITASRYRMSGSNL